MTKKNVTFGLDKDLVERVKMIRKVSHCRFNINIELVEPLKVILKELESKLHLDEDSWKNITSCEQCSKGYLVKKKQRRRPHKVFWGCSNFPNCKMTKAVK